MAFVGSDKVPGLAAVRPDRGDHLVGFGLGHARIIGAGDHEHRLGDLADTGQRADFGQLGALLGHTLVAIFHPPQILPVGIGVFKEADEVADRHRALGRGQLVLELHGGRIAHIAAV